jgi:hypothetical protein
MAAAVVWRVMLHLRVLVWHRAPSTASHSVEERRRASVRYDEDGMGEDGRPSVAAGVGPTAMWGVRWQHRQHRQHRSSCFGRCWRCMQRVGARGAAHRRQAPLRCTWTSARLR